MILLLRLLMQFGCRTVPTIGKLTNPLKNKEKTAIHLGNGKAANCATSGTMAQFFERLAQVQWHTSSTERGSARAAGEPQHCFRTLKGQP
jgi:hypothetical protein